MRLIGHYWRLGLCATCMHLDFPICCLKRNLGTAARSRLLRRCVFRPPRYAPSNYRATGVKGRDDGVDAAWPL